MAIDEDTAAMADRAVVARVQEAFARRTEYCVETTTDRVIAAKIPFYSGLPREAVAGAIRRVYLTVAQDLERGEPQAYPTFLATLGAQRSAQGAAVAEILAGMNIGFDTVSEEVATRFADDLPAQLYWERSRARIAYAGAARTEERRVGASSMWL